MPGVLRRLGVWLSLFCFVLFVSFILLDDVSFSAACTNTWDGSEGNGLWSDSDNWDQAHVPISTEVVCFNATSDTDVSIDIAVDVAGIQFETGYSSTVTQGDGVDILTGDWQQDFGSFVGGTGSNLTVDTDDLDVTGSATFTAGTGDYTITGDDLLVQNDAIVSFALANSLYVDDDAQILNESVFTSTSNTFEIAGGGLDTLLVNITNDGVDNDATFNHNNGTVYIHNTDQLNNETEGVITFYNLTVNLTRGAGARFIIGSDPTVDYLLVENDFVFTDGYFYSVYADNFEIQGDVTMTMDLGSGAQPISMTGSSSANLNLGPDPATAFNGTLTINKTGGASVVLTSNFDLNQTGEDIIIEEGTFDLNGNDLSVDDTIQVESGGTLDVNGGTLDIDSVGELIIDSGGVADFGGATNVDFANRSSGYILDNSGTIKLLGNETFVIADGKDLDLATAGTVQFEGTGSYASGLVLHDTEYTYYNLSFTGSGTWTLNHVLIVGNNLTVSAGALNAGSLASDVEGDVTVGGSGTFVATSGTMTVAGDLSNSGTFTHNSGTVVLDGTDQEIAGTFTFNNLTKSVSAARTLTLPAGATTTISGTATLNGADGQLLSLVSSTPDTQSTIAYAGTWALTYLDLTDQAATTTVGCIPGCVSTSNNTNYVLVAAVTITGTVDVAESGATSDTYTAVLSFPPTDDVVVTLTVDTDEITTDTTELTFTNGNWDTPQTVTVTAVNDDFDDAATYTSTITHAVASDNTNFDGIDVDDVVVTITDNDTAAVVFSETELEISESGVTDSYTAVLASKPTSNVVVTITYDTRQQTPSATILTFTSANWNTPQTVSVLAIDDATPEGRIHLSALNHAVASSDTNYSGLAAANVVSRISDNDFSSGSSALVIGRSITTSQPARAVTRVKYKSARSGQLDRVVNGTILETKETIVPTVSGRNLARIFERKIKTGASARDLEVVRSVEKLPVVAGNSGAVIDLPEHIVPVAQLLEPVDVGVQGRFVRSTSLKNNDQNIELLIAADTKVMADGQVYTGKIDLPRLREDTSNTDVLPSALEPLTLFEVKTDVDHIDFDKFIEVVLVLPDDLDLASFDLDQLQVWQYGAKSAGWQQLDVPFAVDLATRKATFFVKGFTNFAVVKNNNIINGSFIDTKEHWAVEWIDYLAQRNVVKGKGLGIFAPDDNITRAELIKIAVEAFDYKFDHGYKPNFVDLNEDHWAYEYIAAASSLGIVEGYSDNTVRPNNEINRVEALKILTKASSVSLSQNPDANNNFVDVLKDDWFYDVVGLAAGGEIVEGYKDGTFAPGKPITRAEAAKIAVKLLQYKK